MEMLDVMDPTTEVSKEIILSQQLHDFVKVVEEYKVVNKDDAVSLLGKLTAIDKAIKVLKPKVYDYLAKRCPNCDNAIYEGIEINQVVSHEFVYKTQEILDLEAEMEELKIKLTAAKAKAKAEAEAIEAQISLERNKMKPDSKVLEFLKTSLSKIREKVVKSVYWKAKF